MALPEVPGIHICIIQRPPGPISVNAGTLYLPIRSSTGLISHWRLRALTAGKRSAQPEKQWERASISKSHCDWGLYNYRPGLEVEAALAQSSQRGMVSLSSEKEDCNVSSLCSEEGFCALSYSCQEELTTEQLSYLDCGTEFFRKGRSLA